MTTNHHTHSTYDSVWDWLREENIPLPFREEDSDQYHQLCQRLWKQHKATLSTEEQLQLAEDRHPSQSHRFYEVAEPVAEQLRAQLADLACVEHVEMLRQQCDMLQIGVVLSRAPTTEEQRRLPCYFRGFFVRYYGPWR